jgi:hypothetical protein
MDHIKKEVTSICQFKQLMVRGLGQPSINYQKKKMAKEA